MREQMHKPETFGKMYKSVIYDFIYAADVIMNLRPGSAKRVENDANLISRDCFFVFVFRFSYNTFMKSRY